ncbi:hypothetical protein QWY85_09760 [Neolewinella lacunae]|uniref:Transposase/invertase (TIGR01784 family) n=1 Tax=Neolewinella lacunae TaxID=1517758 RepID=A0A923T887_9BACT|nr:hypothetical protein [Neolewinella lacunae]MBC6994299.1 hypothetical protein [Neolewinella lacunae]MDN3634944.1 hypothetical protein [Neolewinella lacunae]
MSSIAGKFVNPLTDFGSSRKWLDAAEVAKLSSEERQTYETSLKHYRDLKNVIDTAREEGKKLGREIGLKLGRELGLQLGRELALQESIEQHTREIARTMKLNGISAEVIADSTGLRLAEIAEL